MNQIKLKIFLLRVTFLIFFTGAALAGTTAGKQVFIHFFVTTAVIAVYTGFFMNRTSCSNCKEDFFYTSSLSKKFRSIFVGRCVNCNSKPVGDSTNT